MEPELRSVFVASGEIHAQQVRAFLESAGISTVERGEALRNTHGLTVDGLGAVEILVSKDDVDRARSLLNEADAGAFRLGDEVENSSLTADVSLPARGGGMDCSVCKSPMQSLGQIPIRVGGTTGGWQLLFGKWAEIGEGVVPLDVYRCAACKRVEFFDLDLSLPTL